jgi:hypothetical protein
LDQDALHTCIYGNLKIVSIIQKLQQSIQILDFNLKTMATCFDQINDKINKMEGIWNPIISKQAAGGKG